MAQHGCDILRVMHSPSLNIDSRGDNFCNVADAVHKKETFGEAIDGITAPVAESMVGMSMKRGVECPSTR